MVLKTSWQKKKNKKKQVGNKKINNNDLFNITLSKIWFAYFSTSYVFIPQFSFASSDHCSVLNTFD